MKLNLVTGLMAMIAVSVSAAQLNPSTCEQAGSSASWSGASALLECRNHTVSTSKVYCTTKAKFYGLNAQDLAFLLEGASSEAPVCCTIQSISMGSSKEDAIRLCQVFRNR